VETGERPHLTKHASIREKAPNYLCAGLCALLALSLFLPGTMNFESTPPLWWDEGWTLSVVRNWVERGHYGRLLDGEPASPGLAASFPVIAPIALSFRLFGVGVWQGRLVGVLFTLGALALIYYLACRLYDRSVAIWTLAVLLLMSVGGNADLVLFAGGLCLFSVGFA
jgi:4-amino-4-deoxy-L-arabinose transferase-like glycosyltransferase